MNLPGARMYGIITFTFFLATLKTTSMERAGNALLQSNADCKAQAMRRALGQNGT